MSFSSDSSWICQFPISLAIEGGSCYENIARAGVGRLLFCTVIYSPYRLVLPRYPQRGIYSMEEGKYHYLPQPKRYQDLPVSPTPSSDWEGRDLLAEAVDGAQKAGVSPGAWVTIFANGMIAKNYPDWAVRNLYGSADRLFLCFNNPEVVEYSLRVGAELAERYELTEIMLDKIPQLCMEVDAFHGRVDPVLRVLGSFCFCPHCVKAAAKRRIDLEDCRRKALAMAAKCLAIPPHVVNAQLDELKGDTEIPLLLLDHPWITDLLRFRMECISDFLTDMRKRLDAARKGVTLTLAFVPPVKVGHDASQPRPWLAAQSYAAYKNAAADLIHCVVHWEADVVQYNTRRAVDALEGGNTRIATHLRAYGATRPDELAGLVGAVKRGGADGVAYFCYDLMTQEMLDAVSRINHS
ncbi:MAG: hypothetical protein ACYTF1_13100 [Planctomycetota bacterium]|jgi:hypothetical protein